MSACVVVDTSVAFKWLVTLEEPSVGRAEELLDAQRAGTCLLAAPSTWTIELANALRYSRRLTAEQALILIEQIDAFGVELFDASPERIRRAAALSCRHGISVYDALFLGLAEELDCPLITADHRAFANIDTSTEIRLV